MSLHIVESLDCRDIYATVALETFTPSYGRPFTPHQKKPSTASWIEDILVFFGSIFYKRIHKS